MAATTESSAQLAPQAQRRNNSADLSGLLAAESDSAFTSGNQSSKASVSIGTFSSSTHSGTI